MVCNKKLKFLSSDLDIIKNNIYLKNILKFELKENINKYFDKNLTILSK